MNLLNPEWQEAPNSKALGGRDSKFTSVCGKDTVSSHVHVFNFFFSAKDRLDAVDNPKDSTHDRSENLPFWDF